MKGFLKNPENRQSGKCSPNFNLFIHGGVNYEPYRASFEAAIGAKVGVIETYPSSEGFIAYQDTVDKEGLLLALNSGIFYEFIPMEEVHAEEPTRLSIEEVELNTNYAIVLNTNAGLWGYLIGDTVKFVSRNPYRLVVTGRIKHFISAFGEHVISEEVDKALFTAGEKHGARITEFTVAPEVSPQDGLPYHEWFIEFEQAPLDLEAFAKEIDSELQKSQYLLQRFIGWQYFKNSRNTANAKKCVYKLYEV